VKNLAYCCLACMTVNRTGTMLDDRVALLPTGTPVRLRCDNCEALSLVPLRDVMLLEPADRRFRNHDMFDELRA
jgi:hypothetical protein